ncbi:MAG: twin-arginine translocase subunit TatC [Elusimicrobia bacterium]|nr:twin-arginine translocase subunit TatC [Elusimicrobiota bacterium]MDE2424947.1 twin-arginine translocase subunit TatC [Elusimicrobiota bacterium]
MSQAAVAPRAPEHREDPPMPLTQHLDELRRRLMWGLGILCVGAGVAFYYSQPLLEWLSKPVGRLVFIAPAEAFHTRLKLSFYGGFLLTLPLLLHQVWLFIARALPRQWRRRLLKMVPLSYLLFVSGVLICLKLVIPQAMRFFLSYGTSNLQPFITLSAYLSFVTTLSLAFGAVFQFPLALYALNWMGVLDKRSLAAQRRLAWFISFVVGALFTPDIVGQCCLAGCSIVLFELTLLAMR